MPRAAFHQPSRSFSTFRIFLAPARLFLTSSSSGLNEMVPRHGLLGKIDCDEPVGVAVLSDFTQASSSQAQLLCIFKTTAFAAPLLQRRLQEAALSASQHRSGCPG